MKIMQTRINIGEDEDLKDLLLQAAPIDVCKLIDILTDGAHGRVALAASVKETLRAAHQSAQIPGGRFLEGEIRLVIRELQLFAGNSLRNAARGGGVSYKQAAVDALNYINGTYVSSGSIEEIELSIIRQLITRRWQENDVYERRAIASAIGVLGGENAQLEEIQDAVSEGGNVAIAVIQLPSLMTAPSLINSAKVSALSQIKKLAKNPASLAAEKFKDISVAHLGGVVGLASKEAYRVTLPFIVQAANIRQIHKISKTDGRNNQFIDPTQSPGISSILTNAVIASPNSSSEATWIVGASPETALITAKPLVLGKWHGQARNISDALGSGVDRLAPILQSLPGLAAAAHQQGTDYYRVVVDGALKMAADGNGFRGFVHGADGKIIEHARLFEDPRLQQLANGTALFQIASILVAQKHLADISDRLNSIDKEIKRVAAFLSEQRRSTIVGAMDYLKQVSAPLLNGNRNDAVRQKLEDIEENIGTIQVHLMSEAENLDREVRELKISSAFGTGTLTKSLQDIQTKLLDTISQWTICHRTRIASCQLVSLFDGEEPFVESRIKALNDLETEFFGAEGAVFKAENSIRDRTASMTSIVETEAEISARQVLLDRWHVLNLPKLVSESRDNLLQPMTVLSKTIREPMVLAVKLNDGKVEVLELDDKEFLRT